MSPTRQSDWWVWSGD